MTAAEARTRGARLAAALDDADPVEIRSILRGLTPRQALRVVRAAAAAQGGRLRIGGRGITWHATAHATTTATSGT